MRSTRDKRKDGTEPTVWRLVAGPESMVQYTESSRPSVGMWTADRGGKMERGDIVLMYGTRRLQSYVAIARVCSRPQPNNRVKRLKKDQEFWVYLQSQPLAEPLQRQAVEGQPFAQLTGSGLQTPRGSRANRIGRESLDGFRGLLQRHDETAAKRLDTWVAGRGRYPGDLDEEELRWAEWDRPTTRSPEELILSRKIAERLVKTGDFRYVTPDDIALTRRFKTSASYSLEHPVRDLDGAGSIDILLVDLRRRSPTMLIIEVKVRASMRPGRNPIPQVIRYRAALQGALGDRWAIDALAVAEHFHDDVAEEASRASIPIRVCVPSGRLKIPV
jgi:hypothetical protein